MTEPCALYAAGARVLRSDESALPRLKADFVYNSRPYDGRGWTQFEKGVSTVVAAAITATGANSLARAEKTAFVSEETDDSPLHSPRSPISPRLRKAHETRPKVIDVSACVHGGPCESVCVDHCSPEQLLEEAVAAVDGAVFVGKADKHKVQAMHRFEWVVQTSGERVRQQAEGGDLSFHPRLLQEWARGQRTGRASKAAARGGTDVVELLPVGYSGKRPSARWQRSDSLTAHDQPIGPIGPIGTPRQEQRVLSS